MLVEAPPPAVVLMPPSVEVEAAVSEAVQPVDHLAPPPPCHAVVPVVQADPTVQHPEIPIATAMVATESGGTLAVPLSHPATMVVAAGSDIMERPKKQQKTRDDDDGINDFSAEEAIQCALREGLTLVVGGTASGYKYVYRGGTGTTGRCFQLDEGHGHRGGKGYFKTAEAAALQYARILGIEGSRLAAEAAAAKLTRGHAAYSELENATAEEALAIAEAEGMTLVRSARTASGFKHVNSLKRTHTATCKGFRLTQTTQTKAYFQGANFMTAEAAAVTYVRIIGIEAAAAEASTERAVITGVDTGSKEAKALDAPTAMAQAAQEGLTESVEALRSSAAASGWKHVTMSKENSKRRKPFHLSYGAAALPGYR